MPSYELTFILRPLDEAGQTAVNERITTMIGGAGGEITARNVWGKRHLAYPIRKINEGFYVSLTVNLPPQAVRTVERALQLNDDVLRYLVIKSEEVAAPAPAPAPAAAQPEAAKEQQT